MPARLTHGCSRACSNGHGHTHEHMDHPGEFDKRDPPLGESKRDWDERAFTVGIGGPVGSGKTALVLSLCRHLRDKVNMGVVTNDIFTREDCEFLIRNKVCTLHHACTCLHFLVVLCKC